MAINNLKYKEAKVYLDKNITLKDCLTSIVNTSIPNKQNKFPVELAQSEYKNLVDKNILVSNDRIDYYYIAFSDALSCTVLLDYAIKILNRPLPEDPYNGAIFVEEFLKEICKPKVNYRWYTTEVGQNFRNFIYLEYEHYFIYNLQNIKNIFNKEHAKDSGEFYLKIHLDKTIANYNLKINHFFEIALHLSNSENKKERALEILDEVSSKSIEHARELLQIAKNKKPNEGNILLLQPILIGLSKFDIETAIQESVNLFLNYETETIGLTCLGWLEYQTEEQIIQCYLAIKNHKTENEDFFIALPKIYWKFLKNNISSSHTKDLIIKEYWSLVNNTSQKVLWQVKYWLESINGFEEEKIKFLFTFLNKGIQVDFMHFFQNFNTPLYLFEFVKYFYVNVGLKANIEQFKSSFDMFYIKSPNEFKNGLADLLSNEFGIIRKAGVDLLTSRQWGIYEIDLLNLSETRQSIILDTLLSIPFHIEKILPFALQLRNSPHSKIKKELTFYCIQLIFSYEKVILEILNKQLDPCNIDDKSLLDIITETWDNYHLILKQKAGLIELNPYINQNRYFELYFRTEREYQAEQMDKLHQKNDFFALGVARKINIIRGNAFKLEGTNQDISKLGKLETKTYIDKRYYMDPLAYEFEYQNHFLNKNYT